MPKKIPPPTKTVQRPLPVWASIAAVVVLVAAVVLVLVLNGVIKPLAFGSTPTPTPSPHISVDDAFVLFGVKGVTFLDVRPAQSWKAFRIHNSINIPPEELSSRLSEVPKTDTIIIFDTLGGEPAMQTYQSLKQAGFEKVLWVRGGMEAWVQRGYPYLGTAPY